MAEDPWDPRQYARFRRERSQPFFDLLALVRPKREMRIIDLGCGTGELTRTLHRRLNALETLGIDSSEAMLSEHEAFVDKGLRFKRQDIADLPETPSYDLIFSNAALHWVPDHRRLLARLAGLLRAGGQLAVQVPANADYPTHTVAAALAKEPPFAKALGGCARRWPVLAPETYAVLLHRLGFRE